MDTFLVVVAVIALASCYVLYFHIGRTNLAQIRGPTPTSFLLGSTLELYQEEAGKTDFDWQRVYGDVVHFKSILGEDQLLIADPKALYHILSTSQNVYPSQPERRAVSGFINGKGVAWAHGDAHRKQRRIMLPAFGAPHADAFMKVSKSCAESLCTKWIDVIDGTSDGRAVIDVYRWLSSATLDVFGQAAFGVHLGCLEDSDHILVRSYQNMIASVLGSPSVEQIFLLEASKHIPTWLLEYMFEHTSNSRCVRVRQMRDTIIGVAKDLIRGKAEDLLQGDGDHDDDILGLLVKANMKAEQSEEELLAHIQTLLIGGHETTSHTVEWALLELARRPHMQSKVRAEIREREAAIRLRADSTFTVADFDAMPYTVAFLKEVLRYHCVIPQTYRVAAKDDLIPLSRPITSESGKQINEVLVPKGTRIVVSIAAYNRNPDLWGEDAHEFNPDRWLRDTVKEGATVGVYANLLTFLGGPRACLGWRLAIIETQAFLLEIIGKLEWSLSEKATRIRREACGLVVPTVEGEVERGVQMPLVVSIAPQ
ncbi:cytochrome P450 [Scleroderma citrinum]